MSLWQLGTTSVQGFLYRFVFESGEELEVRKEGYLSAAEEEFLEYAVAVLEIVSPTNKGYYADLDLAAFKERRQRLLSSAISYMEIDAVPVGTRWLPRCLRDLQKHAGVAWSSLPDAAGRRFRGWAWPEAGPRPKVPWDLAEHGVIRLDLEESLAGALATGGIGPPV